jgi:hypothetical protein
VTIADVSDVEQRPPCLERHPYDPCIEHFVVLSRSESAQAKTGGSLFLAILAKDNPSQEHVSLSETVHVSGVPAGSLNPRTHDAWKSGDGRELIYFGTTSAGRRYAVGLYVFGFGELRKPDAVGIIQPEYGNDGLPKSGYLVDNQFAFSGPWVLRGAGYPYDHPWPGGQVSGKVATDLLVSWNKCPYARAGTDVKFFPG